MARTGRRPGDPDTQGDILAAARATFSIEGYHGATIRSIATQAGVDPALVHHYFGTKEDLFAASVQLPVQPSVIADRILADGLEGAGRRAAGLFFDVWEQQPTRDVLLSMLRGAMGTEQGSNVLREFFGDLMLTRVAPRVGGPDVQLRMALVVSHLLGAAVLRHAIRFPALDTAEVDTLVAWVGDAIQPYFTPRTGTDGQ